MNTSITNTTVHTQTAVLATNKVIRNTLHATVHDIAVQRVDSGRFDGLKSAPSRLVADPRWLLWPAVHQPVAPIEIHEWRRVETSHKPVRIWSTG